MEFKEVVAFHGHECPGLAIGYRAAEFAARQLQFNRAADEELVAIVENSSCAVDAIQMVLGCTFGKGNFIFRDYGKQVYSFFKRDDIQSLRVAVKWNSPAESEETAGMWQRFRSGDKAPEVVSVIKASKQKKIKEILRAADNDLFIVSRVQERLPDRAQIFASVTCSVCGEKCMEPKAIAGKDGALRCIPCNQTAV